MLHSQKRGQHKQRPESAEEAPKTLGPEVGGARSQGWGGRGAQRKGPALPLGTKGGAAGWQLAVRMTTGGMEPPRKVSSGDTVSCCKGMLDLGC